jgi:hypothetical protein
LHIGGAFAIGGDLQIIAIGAMIAEMPMAQSSAADPRSCACRGLHHDKATIATQETERPMPCQKGVVEKFGPLATGRRIAGRAAELGFGPAFCEAPLVDAGAGARERTGCVENFVGSTMMSL